MLARGGLAAIPLSYCPIARPTRLERRMSVKSLKHGSPRNDHAVVIVGAGPTGLMLAGELALAGIDVAIVERRASQELIGSRAGGLHARTLEVLDQRGIVERFLAAGQVAQVATFGSVRLDIGDFPTRHP